MTLLAAKRTKLLLRVNLEPAPRVAAPEIPANDPNRPPKFVDLHGIGGVCGICRFGFGMRFLRHAFHFFNVLLRRNLSVQFRIFFRDNLGFHRSSLIRSTNAPPVTLAMLQLLAMLLLVLSVEELSQVGLKDI
jgi:hypothetical protein